MELVHTESYRGGGPGECIEVTGRWALADCTQGTCPLVQSEADLDTRLLGMLERQAPASSLGGSRNTPGY
jgi:hypothetical protein